MSIGEREKERDYWVKQIDRVQSSRAVTGMEMSGEAVREWLQICRVWAAGVL